MINILPAFNGNYEELGGTFVFPEQYGIENIYPVANEVFVRRLNRVGCFTLDKNSRPVIFFDTLEKLADEAYTIRVDRERVTIIANGEKSAFYGLTTLYQMLVMGHGTLKCCVLCDSPRFLRRGVMLDVCRHFFDVEEVKRLIEQMSLLKMNQFHWHLSDDQGFRMESECFPELNKISAYRRLSPDDPLVKRGIKNAGDTYGGFYTKAQIREVIAYAKARQIDVIPEIELPGHGSTILAAFPQYTCSGQPLGVKGTFGIHERIFCAGSDEVYPFLYELLGKGAKPRQSFQIILAPSIWPTWRGLLLKIK